MLIIRISQKRRRRLDPIYIRKYGKYPECNLHRALDREHFYMIHDRYWGHFVNEFSEGSIDYTSFPLAMYGELPYHGRFTAILNNKKKVKVLGWLKRIKC